jgi:hypothetical protein
VADHLALVDAIDLLGERDRAVAIVVDAGDAQQDRRGAAARRPDDLFSGDLRARVIPLSGQRPVLVDPLARLQGAWTSMVLEKTNCSTRKSRSPRNSRAVPRTVTSS